VIHILFDLSGAVRDERLNRMWTLKKVKFVRPSEDQGKENFFNIFILHQVFDSRNADLKQSIACFRNVSADCIAMITLDPAITSYVFLLLTQNRDYGRGSKNCVHESMIPQWMGETTRTT
jgi:double-strand break repair protein MRE11